jgi:hypothetical protein
MTDEEKAHLAADKYGEFLRKKGAHAITVDQVPVKGRRRFGVIAMFAAKPAAKLPSTLRISAGGKDEDIPLRVVKQQKFALD